MKKNIVLIVIGSFLVLVFGVIGVLGYFDNDDEYEAMFLFNMQQFKDLKLGDIESITITRYTEGGDSSENISDRAKIAKIYNRMSNIKLGKETDMTCTDNTTVYSFNMKDKKSLIVEFECDWIIIGNKRYFVK